MQFIEVTVGKHKEIINPRNIVSCRGSDGGSVIETDLNVFNVRESYQQIRPMIGRATGGITTASDVRISEVE